MLLTSTRFRRSLRSPSNSPYKIRSQVPKSSRPLVTATTARRRAPSPAEVQPVSAAEVQPVCAAEVQPVCAAEVQPVCAAEVQPVSAAEVQPVSAAEVQPVCAARLRCASAALSLRPGQGLARGKLGRCGCATGLRAGVVVDEHTRSNVRRRYRGQSPLCGMPLSSPCRSRPWRR
jgi:hypothetical protein